MAEKRNYPAAYDSGDPRAYVPTFRHMKKVLGWILIIIVIAAAIYIGAYIYFWGTSSSGERSLNSLFDFMGEYNPLAWYSTQLGRAQSIGQGGWSTQHNSSESGIIYKDFDVVGTKTIPSGSPIILKYDTDIKNFEGEVEPVFTCYLKSSGIKGKIIPSEPILSSRRKSDVRCSISEYPSNLSGTIEIMGGMSFPFKTSDAKLDVYFTTEKVLDQVGDNDFFRHFDLNVKQPIRTTYNGEPVAVAIGVSDTEDQPIILEDNLNPLVGITLENKWKGNITKLTLLTLYLPDQITINNELSKNPSPLCPFEEAGTERGYTVYDVSLDRLESINFGDSQKINFECWVDIDPSLVRGNYEHKRYLAEIGYIYELKEKSTTITIIGDSTGEEENA